MASFPGVERGPLHYRHLERDKIENLKRTRGHYDAQMTLSLASVEDIQWWISHIESSFRRISQMAPSFTIESDASSRGWGCCVRGSETTAGGEWSPEEAKHHINYLELKAAFLALQSLWREPHRHVRLMIDNTTAVAYIREMGGSQSPSCCEIAKQIWEWAYQHDIWLSACHLPGAMNVVADRESRVFHKETEWKLNAQVFRRGVKALGSSPVIDLFASRSNYQIKPYISWRPDPEAVHVDAFTYDWSNELFYAFPPFSIIPRVLQKIREDRATGILVVPNWPSQPWYPALRSLLIATPFMARRAKDLLHLPTRPQELHPLHKQLDVVLCLLSGIPDLRTSSRCDSPRVA